MRSEGLAALEKPCWRAERAAGRAAGGPGAAIAGGEGGSLPQEAMRRVMERAQDESAYGPDALYIRFALEPALAEEKGVTEVY